MNSLRIAVALPDSMVYDSRHIRDKTEKLGYIARALSIFQVTDIFIYHSPFISPQDAEKEKRVIRNILGYSECPQYLRKHLFPIHRDLEYVGVLPPLATPHHMVDSKLKLGQFREALVYFSEDNKTYAIVGTKHPLTVNNPPIESLKDKKVRKTIRIVKKDDSDSFAAEIVPRELVQEENYWGFKLKFTDTSIAKFGNRLKDSFIIATDRQGKNYNLVKKNLLEDLKEIRKKKSLLFLFGEPRFDLYQMLKGFNKIKLKDISNVIVNTVPKTGTRNIRLEEAVMISLARMMPILDSET
ncbi:MAG: putative RNA uridine N3 methyltransferase [Candidatus Hodarchaeales archaeon]|jgi:predicted SPOUT superfamily RNA methylase MTH1